MNPRTPELIARCRRDEDGESQPAPHRAVGRTISATCQTHSETRGFCNLRVTKAADGGIVLDPHVAGYCVVTLDEAGAGALRTVLIEWMGWEGSR
jgi:hypothetical protein